MQKRANRILSVLLALVMVLSMLPAAVFAAGETDALAGWNISLGDNIGVKFHLNSEDYTVTTTVNGAAVTPAISGKVVTVNVAAAQMTDTIGLTVKNGGETVHTGEYSVRMYADTILNGSYDAEVKDMVKQMLNYGAAAQTYFDYNTGNLANSGITVDAAAVPAEVPEVTVTDNLDGINLYGMSLVFRNKVAVRFYFDVTGNIANFTFSQGTPVQKDGRYYVEIDSINPQDLASDITLNVNGGALSVTYSPLTYIVRMYNGEKTSAALKSLVQAMYGYHLEAVAYQQYVDSIHYLTGLTNHPNGWSADGIYITHDAHDATIGTDWSVRYRPVSADAIKLIRGGETFNIGQPAGDTLVVYGNTNMYFETKAWTTQGGKLPFVDGDQIIIEGKFKHEASGDILVVEKTVICVNGSELIFNPIEAGNLDNHPNGLNGNGEGIYATMAPNAAPVDGWNVEFAPMTADAYYVIRGEEVINIGMPGRGTLVKYENTNYYLKMSSWCTDNFAYTTDDIFVIDGYWKHNASGTVMKIEKTYLYYNGSAWTFAAELPTVIDGGMLLKVDGYGWTGGTGALIFQMNNTAPNGGYTPVEAGNVKLIRNGETYDVGYVGQNVINKSNETWYTYEFWTIVNEKPMLANDILVIEGDFYNAAADVTMNITKTYVLLNEDGSATFSAEMPTLPTTVEGGVMQSHPNGQSGTGIYFKLDANAAPYDGWSYEYKQTSTSGIKLIRDGATRDIGIVDRPLIVKYSDTEYFLKLEGWTVGDYGLNDQSDPITTEDVLIIEGAFTHDATKTILNITKSYVYYDGSAWVCAANLPVSVDCGVMSENAEGWDASSLYFTLSENAVPVDEEMEYPYTGSVSLVKGTTVTAVNVSIYKLAADQYYLELDGAELTDKSYLIVEGAFVNGDNGYTMNIAKTYILAKGADLIYSETEPVLESEYALTGLTNHSNGWSADGIYIAHDAHNATYNSDWSVEYKPVSADVIKLVRDGQTYNIGQPVSGTLVVYDPAKMLFKTAAWTIQGGVLPFVDGDQIIIEGKFKHEGSGDILAVEKTVICVDGSELRFNPIFAGNLGNHSNGINGTDGIYATMAENATPYSSDWTLEYTPMTADAYSVIRGEEVINIGIPGRGTLVKYSATDYYLKLTHWCTDSFVFTTDDIIVVEGFWKHNASGTIIKIEKTYLYYDGSAWTFATKLPSVINAGLMQTHASGMWGNGISFAMNANSAPYNTDWSLEYKQTSADNIKLIRNGETISIGIAGRPLFVKHGETDYYLKLEKWTIGEYGVNGGATPITNDDIIIIEGNFVYDNVTLKITKSYVYYDGSAWVCSADAPAQKNVVDVVDLGSHGSGWSAGGFYFTAAANDAPYDDWSLRYKPVSADVIKCISGDTTTNVGNTGGETIVKYSDTEYYVEGWAVGSANMAAGNTFVMEGQFYNAANDVYIDVEKTYITLNADGSTTVITDSDKYINAGAMSAYDVQNWFDTNYNALYFVLDSNIAPGNTDWSVRYMPLAASNVKLIRNGETVNIGNTGAETIVKIEDGLYALALDNWWWSSYAPIQDGDQLIIEGEFANSSNGYTLKIDKTYITFVSKADDNVVFSTAASTEFGEVLLPNTNETLTIGMWNGSYHVFEDKQLRELQAAGITKIMGIDTQWIGTTDVNAWLDRVYSYGICVIMDLRSWDGETVPSYASHPAVIGFLMHDEPCATEFDNLAALKAKFDAVMPEGKLFYVNLFPSCAAGTSLVGTVDWTLGRRNYDTYYVQKFLDKLDIEVLSWDNYSLLDGNGIRTDYFYNFEVMASKNVPMWYTMLSSGHGTTSASYATPTEDELRWQMAVALTYGVQNIDHYTYVSHEDGYSCMVEYETWEPTDLYYDILKVDNEYLAWDNIFMAYDWVGTGAYSANSNNAMLTKLNNALDYTQYGLASVSANQNLLVGVFDYNGENAYMVTNAGSAGSTTVGDGKNFSMNDTSVTLTLAEGDYKCVAIIDNGEISYVAVNNNTVTLTVEAYEGVFVIPVLN